MEEETKWAKVFYFFLFNFSLSRHGLERVNNWLYYTPRARKQSYTKSCQDSLLLQQQRQSLQNKDISLCRFLLISEVLKTTRREIMRAEGEKVWGYHGNKHTVTVMQKHIIYHVYPQFSLLAQCSLTCSRTECLDWGLWIIHINQRTLSELSCCFFSAVSTTSLDILKPKLSSQIHTTRRQRDWLFLQHQEALCLGCCANYARKTDLDIADVCHLKNVTTRWGYGGYR